MQTSIKQLPASLVFRSAATLISLAAFTVTFAFAISATPASAETHISWSWGSGNTIRGSGIVVERAVTVAAFDTVAVQDGIGVVSRRAAVQKFLVKTDDNLQALVAAKVEGSRLSLRMLTKVSAQTKSGVLVTIDYTTLNALNVSDGVRAELDVAGGSSFRAVAKDGSTLKITEANAGDFDLVVSDGANASIAKATSVTSQRYKVVDGAQLTVNEATADRVTVSVADGANMSLRVVNTRRIDVAVSDGAHLELAGVAQQQNFLLSDGAEVNALRLQGSSTNVDAADGSALKLGTVQTLSAKSQDGSSVRYTGDPVVTINTGDGSSVRKI